jgi:hypothetical protein
VDRAEKCSFTRAVKVAAGLAVLTVGVAGPCPAQQSQAPASRGAALGALRVQPALVVSAGHDTNVYREPTGFADYETYVLPQVAASLPGGRTVTDMWGALELVRFNQNPGATNFQVGAAFEWRGSRIRPYSRANLRQTGANPGLTEVSEIGRKSTRIERDLKSGVDVKVGRALLVSGFVRNVHTDWDADAIYQGSSLREKLNRDDSVLSASADVLLTPLTAVRVSAYTMKSRFEFSPRRDADSAEVSAGVVFRAPAALVGSLQVGVRDFRFLLDEAGSVREPIWEARLMHELRGGGFVSVSTARNVQFTAEPGSDYALGRTLSLRVAKPLAQRWIAGAWVVRDAVWYPRAAAGAAEQLRSDLLSGSVGYKLAASLTIGATCERQTSRGIQEWNAFRVVTFLTFGMGPLQRLDRPLPFER